MVKRKKCITIEEDVIKELNLIATAEKTSFSQLVEDGVTALIEHKRQLEPVNLRATVKEIVMDVLKEQEGIPSAFRKYM